MNARALIATAILAPVLAVLAACGQTAVEAPSAPAPAAPPVQHVAPGVHLHPRPVIRPCAAEDSPGPCYWDASKRGNHRGRSFVVTASGHVFPASVDNNGCLHYGKVTDCLALESDR